MPAIEVPGNEGRGKKIAVYIYKVVTCPYCTRTIFIPVTRRVKGYTRFV